MSKKGRNRKGKRLAAPGAPADTNALSRDQLLRAAAMGDLAFVRAAWKKAEEARWLWEAMRNDILVNGALNGQTDVVWVLIDCGVDVGAVVVEGWTTVEMAAACGHTETAQVLQSAIDRTDALSDRMRLRRVVGADGTDREGDAPGRSRII
jgi:hypothetical protein